MKQFFSIVAFFVLLGASASPTAAELAAAKHAFVPLLGSLSKSAVPVLLPGSLPGPDLINAIPQLESADGKGYAIELGLAPDCGGATACHIGHISGMKSDGSALPGEKVSLPIGVTGYYVLGPCGASCSDSTITFDRNGYRYEFAEKGASKGDLREFAATIVTPAQLKAE
ncbi:MAG TPA: hypothetical protein VK760_16700 [Candidatus Acidoferrales bacterium]|nr:hypothetical protein [Candidatus Acidoferrales bacterium]